MVTTVPTGPLGGLKLNSCGVTRNGTLLANTSLGVVTVTEPVVAPVGDCSRQVGICADGELRSGPIEGHVRGAGQSLAQHKGLDSDLARATGQAYE